VSTRDAILSIRALSVALPTVPRPVVAVDRLSLDLYPGEVTALIGESGSGKSATILALLGLLPAGAVVSGEMIIGEERVAFPDERALARLRGRVFGAVFQDPLASLNPVLTIGEQIEEVFRAHRGHSHSKARRASIGLLERVGLPDPAARARDYAHRLSGGQRQRAAIAMALAGRPRVLLADEPTSALDPTVQAQILDLLLDLVQGGTALLLVTHDLAFAAEAADRVAVIYAGHILEHGPVAEVALAPAHPYTQALLAASLPFGAVGSGSLPGIPGRMPAPGEVADGCIFAPRCPQVRAACRQGQPPVVAMGKREVACVLAKDGMA
jgi:oligopeptide/dipeptide ABC transporter ATP-binding protein